MTSRSTPPIVPTFGDPSGNQPYTMLFDGVIVDNKNANQVVKRGDGTGGQVLKESKSKKLTNVTKKPSTKASSNATNQKAIYDDHLQSLKTKDLVDMKDLHSSRNERSTENHNHGGKTPSRYQGRLGNRASSYPQKPPQDKTRPQTRHGSSTSSLQHRVEAMKFGDWEDNPKVDITGMFDLRKQEKEAGLSLRSPASYSDGRLAPLAHKRISNDDHKNSSWWSSSSLKKWWRRLLGST